MVNAWKEPCQSRARPFQRRFHGQGHTSYASRIGSIQNAAFNDHRLVHEAAAYMGTLTVSVSTPPHGREQSSSHEEYSHHISLKQRLPVVLAVERG